MKKIVLVLAILISGLLNAQTGIQGAGKFKMTTPVAGTLSDSCVVWNGTDKFLKFIPISSIASGGGYTSRTVKNMDDSGGEIFYTFEAGDETKIINLIDLTGDFYQLTLPEDVFPIGAELIVLPNTLHPDPFDFLGNTINNGFGFNISGKQNTVIRLQQKALNDWIVTEDFELSLIQTRDEKVTTLSSPNDDNYPTTEAVTDYAEPKLPAGGTTGQYLRGDKTWQTLSAAVLGVGTKLKDPVQWVAHYNLPLTGSHNIAGGGVTDGDRIFAMNQTNPSEFGIWIYNNSGAWTRSTDFALGSIQEYALIPLNGVSATGSTIGMGDYAAEFYGAGSAAGVVVGSAGLQGQFLRVGSYAQDTAPTNGSIFGITSDAVYDLGQLKENVANKTATASSSTITYPNWLGVQNYVSSFGYGTGTVTSVTGTTNRITSTGGATPAIDVSATFEALLAKVANRIDQNNASTTSAQFATVVSDETGTGNVVFNDSPTFTTHITTPEVVVSGATATTIASFDGSKNIKSLSTATYPSLTELAYVKGVTSAVQTQINTNSSNISTNTADIATKMNKPSMMKLQSAYVLSNSTSLQKIFNVGSSGNGSFNAAANKTYRFKCDFYVTGLSASAGTISFGVLGTAGISAIFYNSFATKNAGTATASQTFSNIATILTITTSTSQTVAKASITGIITTSSAGTIIPALATSIGVGTAQTEPLSYFQIEEVGADTFTATSDMN